MNNVLLNNFADAFINTDENPIIYEGIKYYSIINNIDNVEYLTIDYGNREIIYSIQCIIYNNNHIICCNFTNSKIVNNIEVEGIYIIVNKLIKLVLKYITCDATFKNKNCCESFDDMDEIYRDDFELLSDDDQT
jgi:hypothetical protein